MSSDTAALNSHADLRQENGASHHEDECYSPSDIINQYDSDSSVQFYKIIMGDGGFCIHYGVFDAVRLGTRLLDNSLYMTTCHAVSL